MSGAHPAGTPGPPIDVAAAVRRGQRRLVLRLAAMWVVVLAVTAGLVGAGIWVRSQVHPPVPVIGPCTAPVPVPTGVTVVYDNDNGVVRVSWQAAERPGLRFVVDRDDAEMARTDTLAVDDRAAVPGGMHTYTVRAVTVTGECGSEPSSPASVMVPPLAPPTELRADATDTAVDLRWTSTDPRARSYLVVRDGTRLGVSVTWAL